MSPYDFRDYLRKNGEFSNAQVRNLYDRFNAGLVTLNDIATKGQKKDQPPEPAKYVSCDDYNKPVPKTYQPKTALVRVSVAKQQIEKYEDDLLLLFSKYEALTSAIVIAELGLSYMQVSRLLKPLIAENIIIRTKKKG